MDLVAQPVYIEHWAAYSATSTFGKREKDIRVEPSTKKKKKLHYFKQSDKRYPWDFWCEVIASKLGQLLHLDIAIYEPAYLKKPDGSYFWGCLCPLLNDPEAREEFVHGEDYLTPFKPDFETKRGTDHGYELILNAFDLAGGDQADLLKFHEMLVFDALICNRDRHQANWAFIRSKSEGPIPEPPPMGEEDEDWLKKLVDAAFDNFHARLAPIYDSGTSLGHNLLEGAMEQMLADPQSTGLLKFATGSKATAHLRWKGQRLRHDELLTQIGHVAPDLIIPALKKVTEGFDEKAVSELLDVIDDKVTPEIRRHLIPPEYMLTPIRKEFIKALLYLRHRKLCETLRRIQA